MVVQNSEVEFYNEIYTANPDKWGSEWRDKMAFEIIVRWFEPRSIIDIGCGNGHTLLYFKYKRPSLRTRGVDLSPVAIELAQEKLPEGEFWAVDFMLVDPPESDLAIVMGAAEHFYDLDAFLEKLAKVAKYAYIEAPNCIAYSDSKEEGYRETSKGIGQVEWHLKRETWEEKIGKHFEFIAKIDGVYPTNQFIWVLKRPNAFVGHHFEGI